MKITLPHTESQTAVISFDRNTQHLAAIRAFEVWQVSRFGDGWIVLKFFQFGRFQDAAEITTQDASLSQLQISKDLVSAFATGNIVDLVITAETL